MNTIFRIARSPFMAATMLLLLSACTQEWRSEPVNTEQDFGNSVRNMVEAQTLDPARIANPDPEPVQGLAGDKSASVYAEYRKDVSKPTAVERPININVLGGSGGR